MRDHQIYTVMHTLHFPLQRSSVIEKKSVQCVSYMQEIMKYSMRQKEQNKRGINIYLARDIFSSRRVITSTHL